MRRDPPAKRLWLSLLGETDESASAAYVKQVLLQGDIETRKNSGLAFAEIFHYYRVAKGRNIRWNTPPQ